MSRASRLSWTARSHCEAFCLPFKTGIEDKSFVVVIVVADGNVSASVRVVAGVCSGVWLPVVVGVTTWPSAIVGRLSRRFDRKRVSRMRVQGLR